MRQEVKVRAYLNEDMVGLLDDSITKLIGSTLANSVHGNLKHTPPMPLHTMTSPWPFFTWGIDIIGKIHPTTSNGHEFILVAIDYFTKWIEAASYKVLNSKKVAQFIHTKIICRYGVVHEIISDNGQHFKGETEKLL